MTNHPFLQEAVGIVIEKLRKERKLTKRALADFADIQDSYLRCLIQGKRNLSIGVIYSLCKALDISVTAFLEKVEETRKSLSVGEGKKLG